MLSIQVNVKTSVRSIEMTALATGLRIFSWMEEDVKSFEAPNHFCYESVIVRLALLYLQDVGLYTKKDLDAIYYAILRKSMDP